MATFCQHFEFWQFVVTVFYLTSFFVYFNYLFLHITWCSEPNLQSSFPRPEYSWKIARWTLNTNQSNQINQPSFISWLNTLYLLEWPPMINCLRITKDLNKYFIILKNLKCSFSDILTNRPSSRNWSELMKAGWLKRGKLYVTVFWVYDRNRGFSILYKNMKSEPLYCLIQSWFVVRAGQHVWIHILFQNSKL